MTEANQQILPVIEASGGSAFSVLLGGPFYYEDYIFCSGLHYVLSFYFSFWEFDLEWHYLGIMIHFGDIFDWTICVNVCFPINGYWLCCLFCFPFYLQFE